MPIKYVFAVALCATFLAVGATSASASSTKSTASCAGAVHWSRATGLIGRVATLKGVVAGSFYASRSNGSPTFLNLGVDYPNPRRFTVIIWGRDRGNFRVPESRYRGRTICVRGLVRPYQGMAEMFASFPSQIALG